MDRLNRHDQKEWTDEQLFDELLYLVELKQRPYYNEERRAEISRAIGRVTMEQEFRYAETHPSDELLDEIDSIPLPKEWRK